MGEKTLHIDGSEGEEKTDQEVVDAVAEGIDSVLDPEPDTEIIDGETAPENEEPEKTEIEADLEEKPVDEDKPLEDPVKEDAEPIAAKEVDYTVPEDLTEKSSERFSSIVNDNKELRGQLETANETVSGMQQLFKDSGLTNEEILGAIDFAAEVKTSPQQGLERMRKYMLDVSKSTGIKVEGFDVDMLEDYPDLKTQVDDEELTESGALEIASSRRQKNETAALQDSSDKERVYNTSRTTALEDVGSYLTGLSKSDIDWQGKSPMLMESVKFARDNLHPDQWKGYVEKEYDKITRISASFAAKQKPTPTPITGTSSSRGGSPEPTNIGELLNQQL